MSVLPSPFVALACVARRWAFRCPPLLLEARALAIMFWHCIATARAGLLFSLGEEAWPQREEGSLATVLHVVDGPALHHRLWCPPFFRAGVVLFRRIKALCSDVCVYWLDGARGVPRLLDQVGHGRNELLVDFNAPVVNVLRGREGGRKRGQVGKWRARLREVEHGSARGHGAPRGGARCGRAAARACCSWG